MNKKNTFKKESGSKSNAEHKTSVKNDSYSSREFFLEDFRRTLFPLRTNEYLVETGAEQILEFANRILNGQGSFLTQRRVFANKDKFHLRRTVKLDPIAEFFFYDIIYRNRMRFRKPHVVGREHFGYRFENGRPISPSQSYSDFKQQVWEGTFLHEEFISFDVSNYFNGVYHHDLQAWFDGLGADEADVEAFGKFLRQMNAGRSLDCLPQGLYPAKMIGNDFLRFIEESSSIRSNRITRFMDDVYFFDNRMDVIRSDFAEVQGLLGLKGLAVNASKTQSGGIPVTDKASEDIDELKKRLLRKRRFLIVTGYDDEAADDSPEEDDRLSEEEIEYVVSLLDDPNLREEDAELVLIVTRDHAERVGEHLGVFARGFPHLAKNFYGLCSEIADKDDVAAVVLDTAKNGEHVGEYQLFWFGVMLEDYLLSTEHASDLIYTLYHHPNATDVSRAKLLEIPDLRYGLTEMREAFLREGRSDWLSWASAVGSRALKRAGRNYLLDYFKNGSAMNRLIAEIVQKT